MNPLPKTASSVPKTAAYAFGASAFVELASCMYLLLFDPLLKAAGPLHWFILLIYTVILSFFSVGYLMAHRAKFALAVGIFSLLMFFAMLADGALGLPLSSAHFNGPAWSYLFGFGAPGSSFGTSLAFTVMLAFAAVTSAVSFYAYKH